LTCFAGANSLLQVRKAFFRAFILSDHWLRLDVGMYGTRNAKFTHGLRADDRSR
jgi:hypothetical protein